MGSIAIVVPEVNSQTTNSKVRKELTVAGTMTEQLFFEEWLARGQTLLDQVNTLHWQIGDWLIEGRTLDKCGKSVREAAAGLTGYSVITLWEKERVAEKFPPKSRRLGSKLEWSYFQAAAALPSLEARLEMIDRAMAEGIKLTQFRELVAGKRADAVAKQRAPRPKTVMVPIDDPAKAVQVLLKHFTREQLLNAFHRLKRCRLTVGEIAEVRFTTRLEK